MNPRQRSIADGWIELESDPGLFTLLIEDYGVSGVEVEEVYDLQASIPGPVYGFIFLFKWLDGVRRSRRNPKFELSPGITVTDENLMNSMFFAQQKIQNSCATHAILSILMNSKDISLGPTLTELKSFTNGMSSENKGIALSNVPKLVLAHNKHARPDACRDCEEESDKGSTGTGGGGGTSSIGSTKWHETFHFASFLPIDDHLYEMDSLKPYPIDHGKIPDNMEWQQYFLQLLYDKIAATNANESHEIRYNLMALVPRKLDKLKDNLDLLKANCDLLALAMKSLVLAIDPDVFRRVFQMSSFTSRKKLRDFEILQAAQYVLLSESQSPTSSLNGDQHQDSNNVRQQQKLSTECEREPQQPSTSTAPPPTELPFENVAELDCMNNNGYALAPYLSTYLIEDFEICVAPAKAIAASQSSLCASSSSINANGTAKNNSGGGDTASPGVDVVELSTSAPVYPNLPPKNAFSLRKMVKLRFAAPCSEMELLSLKELIRYFNLLSDEISKSNALIEEQSMKRRAYEIDDERRAHDYDTFINTFFQTMVNCGFLQQNEVPTKTNKRKKSSTISSSDQEQQQKLSSFVNKRKANHHNISNNNNNNVKNA